MELQRPSPPSSSTTTPTTGTQAKSPMSTKVDMQGHTGHICEGDSVDESSEVSSAAREQFDLLRPITIQVMSSPTVTNLSQLIEVVSHFPDTVDACILDYIVFPLSHHLKFSAKQSEDVLINLHDCVKDVLNKWEIPKFTNFAELYQFCMMSICKEDDPGSFDKSLSETLVERVVLSIHALIERSLPRHFKKLYSEKYIAAVGHGICILLQIVNQDTTKSLRIQAIRTIVFLIRICEGDSEACHRIFKFLPGLATTFVRCSIIHGGRYRVEVIKESLGALKIALITCISYETAESLVPVDTNLSPGIIEISESLLFHDDKRLRDALADLTISVISDTKMKLPKCSETLWNNVLVFAGNVEHKESSTKCLNFLRNPNNKTLALALCNFKVIEHHLKKAVIQSNIGELSKCCLTAHGVAGAVSVTNLSIPEFQCVLPRIADLRTTVVRRQQEYEDKPLQLQDRQIVNACNRMCQFLLELQDIQVVVAEFFNLLDRGNNLEDVTSLRSSGTILLMNEVLSLLLATKPPNLTPNLVETITEKYLTLLCPLPIVIEIPASERKKGLPAIGNRNSANQVELVPSTSAAGINVHTCSILEAFPILTDLDPQLFQLVTFPLLEYAGLREPDYSSVSRTALDSLTNIAKLSNLTLREYLSTNLDLVMSEFGSRIEVIADSPHMVDALIFLAEYFDFSQNMFLEFIEQIILFSTSQNLDQKFHHMFTNIYKAYVLSMWKHYYENKQKQLPEKPKDTNTYEDESDGPSIRERLLAYQMALGLHPSDLAKPGGEYIQNVGERLHKISIGEAVKIDNVTENGTADSELDCKESEEPDPPEEKVPIPPEISLTLKIARKAAAYLSGETRDIKLNSMEVLIKAIQMLSPYEDELLPLLHQCWETLASRFQEREYVVLRKSFELLLTMVNFSGTFLKRRTIEGIFPILSIFLEELAEHSKNIEEKNKVYYTFTQGFKLQHTILTGLAELCDAMEISERDLDRVADACLIYLSPVQHQKLREAAKQMLLDLGYGRFGAAIWMKLIGYGLIPEPEPPAHEEFRTLPSDFVQRHKDELKKKNFGRSHFRK